MSQLLQNLLLLVQRQHMRRIWNTTGLATNCLLCWRKRTEKTWTTWVTWPSTVDYLTTQMLNQINCPCFSVAQFSPTKTNIEPLEAAKEEAWWQPNNQNCPSKNHPSFHNLQILKGVSTRAYLLHYGREDQSSSGKENIFYISTNNLSIRFVYSLWCNKGRFCNNSEMDTLISKRLPVENKEKLSQLEIVNKQYCGGGVFLESWEFRFVLYR